MMPDFDGRYLCFIEVKEKCGAVNFKWEVISCVFNTWITKDNEKVLSWQETPALDFADRFRQMKYEIESKMEMFDFEKRKKAATSLQQLENLICNV